MCTIIIHIIIAHDRIISYRDKEKNYLKNKGDINEIDNFNFLVMSLPLKTFKNSKKLIASGARDLKLRNLNVNPSKFAQAAAAAAATELGNLEWEKAKPLSAIPGPKPIPFIPYGNLWRFTKFGTYGTDLMGMNRKLVKEFGPIVRVTGMVAQDFVFLYDPHYIETMYRNESAWPIRDTTPSFGIFREKFRPDIYSEYAGLATTQGAVWQKSRSALNQTMMQPRNTKIYVQPIDEVANDLVERIKMIRDAKSEVPENFINELNKWALESIALIALDTRLGCLDGNLDPNSETQTLINAIHEMFYLVFQLDLKASPYRYISTPTWRKYVKTMSAITNITEKQVNRKLDALKEKLKDPNYEPNSVLETLFFKQHNPKLAVVMAMDMLIAGVDTTANSTGAALYYIAKNPDKQEKLFEELKRFLPDKKSPITAEKLNDMKYMKACIKESMRLAPIAPGNQRRAAKDFVIGEYQIPKGTQLFAANLVLCEDERYFKHPKEFLPERWLKTDKVNDLAAKYANPFVFLPFGFGPRTCIGRRFAELEMETAVSKLIRNFKMEYNYGEMTWKQELLYMAAKPFQFKMEERPN